MNPENVRYFVDLELNIFQKKLGNSLEIKILKLIETSIYFNNVWICLYIFLYVCVCISCEKVEVYKSTQVNLMNIKKWQNDIKIFSRESKQVKMYGNVCNKYRKCLKYYTFLKNH